MKFIITLFSFIFLGINSFCQTNSILEVEKYKGIFKTPPQDIPTSKVPNAPIAGNGDIGIVYAGTPDLQCFYFSKNDFWKAKEGYPDGGVCLPGGLKITVSDLIGASYYSEQSIKDGTISAIFKKNGLIYRMKAWVQATENLVIIQLTSKGKPCTVTLDLWAQTGNDSRVDSGTTKGIYWFERHFDDSDLDWPTHIAVGMKILGAEGLSFKLKPDSKVTLVLSFTTNHETNDYFANTINKIIPISPDSIKQLSTAHINWWKNFWQQSHIEISDTFLEKYYYGSQYLLASCSRNDEFPPGLWGNSLTMDAGFNNWEGDYHTNYNYEAAWWGAYSSNHIELTEGYDAPILAFIPKAKWLSKTLLNCNGVYYPVGIGPKGFCSSRWPLTAEKMMHYYHTDKYNIDSGYMFLGQKSNALFLTTNMLMRFYSTYDKKYAEKIYPFLHEVADFWDSYLKFENGRYVDYNDNFWEVGPWFGKNWEQDYGDVNPTLSLGLLRMFYKGMLDISEYLHRDGSQRKKWNFILQHLSPIPTTSINGAVRIMACEGGTGSGSRTLPGMGRVMMQGLVFPSGITGVKTDPKFAEILRQEIDRWGKMPKVDTGWRDVDWNDLGNGFETFFTAAARLEYDPQKLLGKLKWRIKKTSLSNLWVPSTGGGIETLSAIPSCINEMLMQGYEGIIRVFPNWPSNKDAKYKDLRAYGAFLVSSEQKNGMVTYIRITSERGRKCKIENPWKGKKVLIQSDLYPDKILSGDNILIHTHVNEKIVIYPIND